MAVDVGKLSVAVQTMLDGASGLLRVAHDNSPSLWDASVVVAQRAADVGNRFRNAPDDYAGVGQAVDDVLAAAADVLQRLRSEPDPAVREQATSAVQCLLQAGTEFSAAAVERVRPTIRSAFGSLGSVR